ncbi:MAG TPA: hypothetical protein VHC73_04460 [Vitreimonas sp.]|nr:hypothetical protein [Vitreimonas sp.]
MIYVVGAIVLVLLIAVMAYISTRYYEGRYDRTYMTQDERGFRRGLKGKTVLWDVEESIVRGPTAPRLEYVALDPATGGRRTVALMDAKTGSINLRPQFAAPLPFETVTADDHKVMVDARVQFSINRDLLKHVYEVQDLSQALDMRVHSAFRAEIGKLKDEELRASIAEVERGVVARLRQLEEEGDEKGEKGMALGINFHTASFSFVEQDEFAVSIPGLAPGVAPTPEQAAAIDRARQSARAQGVLSLRPQQLDQIADVFKDRDAAGTAALLAMLEMQTRQNIAEALAAAGQLVVVTPNDIGLVGLSAQREAAAARTRAIGEAAPTPPPLTNGGAVRPENRP